MDLQGTVSFLEALQSNNNREWFNANKARYDDARASFEAFIGVLIPVVRGIDPDVDVDDPGECLFRIYRDVRFSGDKSPYKNNFGAFLAKGGRKSPYAGYYLHIEPGASFVGGGAYMPQAPYLKAIRRSIYEHPREYKAILHSDDFSSCFGTIFGETLKTSPRDFPKDFPDIELLKHKHYAVTHPVDDQLWFSGEVIDRVREIFAVLYPFNRFLNAAIASVMS